MKLTLNYSGDGPDIGWLRASEISEKPVLFAEGATRFDINQVRLYETN